MLTTKDLKKIAEKAGLNERYLFSYVGIENYIEHNPKDVILAIKNYRQKRKKSMHNDTDVCLLEIIKHLSDIEKNNNEIVQNNATTINTSTKTIMLTAEELAKKIKIPSGSAYWYLRNVEPDSLVHPKKYSTETIKNAFKQILKRNTKYEKELRNFIDNTTTIIPNIKPQAEQKQPETIIELQKETNNLLRQLLEIWRK